MFKAYDLSWGFSEITQQKEVLSTTIKYTRDAEDKESFCSFKVKDMMYHTATALTNLSCN
ncbi:MAG: hypothetical protein M3299_06305 [Thermoproteota archaeon]|nr:hypothetical protein [Thermoproteota archaeon]